MKNKEAAWVISAREPLPMVVERGFNAMRVYTYERPILEVCLRPLLDPDLGVTDEEVKELYSPKGVSWVVSSKEVLKGYYSDDNWGDA